MIKKMSFKSIKRRLLNLYSRIRKRISVPRYVHEKALDKIATRDEEIERQNKHIKMLEDSNRLLERQVIALEKDLQYKTEESIIDQAFIAKMLIYTRMPDEERKSLERKIDKLKSLARRFYGTTKDLDL